MKPRYQMYQPVDRHDVMRHADTVVYDGPFRFHDRLLIVRMDDAIWYGFDGARELLSVTLIADNFALVTALVEACQKEATQGL